MFILVLYTLVILDRSKGPELKAADVVRKTFRGLDFGEDLY